MFIENFFKKFKEDKILSSFFMFCILFLIDKHILFPLIDLMKDKIIDIFIICLVFILTFFITIQTPSINSLFPSINPSQKKLILVKNTKEIELIYVNEQKEKIVLNYNVDNKTKKIQNNNIPFFDFFQIGNKNILKSISILKYNSKNLEKEFKEDLNTNAYVGYIDKAFNSLYLFAHNGTLGINGGTIFYNLKEGEEVIFMNSLIGQKEKYKVINKKILIKKDFIDSFVNNDGIFNKKDTIYMITCYPNYKSTSRLILQLKKI